MCRQSRPPSQSWRTFLSNHADGIAAVDLFILPTIAFRILYCLVIIRHGRRIWLSFGVTENPTAEWISRQITEAFPWDMRRDTSFGIGTSRTGQSSCSVCAPWAFEADGQTIFFKIDYYDKNLTYLCVPKIRFNVDVGNRRANLAA